MRRLLYLALGLVLLSLCMLSTFAMGAEADGYVSIKKTDEESGQTLSGAQYKVTKQAAERQLTRRVYYDTGFRFNGNDKLTEVLRAGETPVFQAYEWWENATKTEQFVDMFVTTNGVGTNDRERLVAGADFYATGDYRLVKGDSIADEGYVISFGEAEKSVVDSYITDITEWGLWPARISVANYEPQYLTMIYEGTELFEVLNAYKYEITVRGSGATGGFECFPSFEMLLGGTPYFFTQYEWNSYIWAGYPFKVRTGSDIGDYYFTRKSEGTNWPAGDIVLPLSFLLVKDGDGDGTQWELMMFSYYEETMTLASDYEIEALQGKSSDGYLLDRYGIAWWAYREDSTKEIGETVTHFISWDGGAESVRTADIWPNGTSKYLRMSGDTAVAGTDEPGAYVAATDADGLIKLDTYRWGEGVYVVEEIKAPAGYRIDPQKQTFKINTEWEVVDVADQKIDGGLVLNFRSEPLVVNLCKINADDNTVVGGVEFVLKMEDNDLFQPQIVTVPNGEVSIKLGGLPDGTYVVEEYKAPEGYVALVDRHKFKIENGAVFIDGSNERTYNTATLVFESRQVGNGADSTDNNSSIGGRINWTAIVLILIGWAGAMLILEGLKPNEENVAEATGTRNTSRFNFSSLRNRIWKPKL